jgi:gliding motility-associated-like protein
MLYRFFCRLLFVLLISSGTNQVWSQVGKEFWFAIPKETSGHDGSGTTGFGTNPWNASFKVTNVSDVLPAHVVISMPAPGSGFTTRVFDVAPSATHVEVVANSWLEFANVYANPSAYTSTSLTGITKHGINITSDNDITVYYDYNNYYNRDLFSLKGENALGKDFYLPFQNQWANGSSYSPKPVSEGIIVATQDGTTVTIYTTKQVKDQPLPITTPIVVTLNKGETYSIVANGQSESNHFTGTHVVSDKPIAITINDDSLPVKGRGCYDICGDQIIPTNVIGKEYVVMTGDASSTKDNSGVLVPWSAQKPERGEQIYVTGTVAGTTISFEDRAGNVKYTTTIGVGVTDFYTPDILDTLQTSIYVHGNNPFYVFHITGIDCEMGGAILPPITNCTGSNEVSFYRSSISSGGGSTMTLNLMIPYNASIPFTASTQSHYMFKIYKQDGTYFTIPGAWFEPVPNAGWAVLKQKYRSSSNGGVANYIPIDEPVRVTNSSDFFHLGITNGIAGQTNKYGYFSSFNATQAAAVVASINEKSYISCFGDTVFLRATGGLAYAWHYGSPGGPTTYISNSNSSTPQVFCPPGTHDFYVIVKQSKCFGDDTLKVTVDVIPEVKAIFESDITAACSPFRTTIKNLSTGATKYTWSYRRNSDPVIPLTPPSQTSFVQPSSGDFTNTSTPYKPITYTYKLIASYKGECPDSASKTITVYPIINADFDPHDTTSCNPTLVNFRNISNGNVVDSMYIWDFGDGNSSPVVNPIHKFENIFNSTDITYNVNLVATSPYYCRDTAKATVTVHPFLKAGFTVDTVRGCSPLTIKLTNTSLNRKAISEYIWDFGDGVVRTVNKDTLVHTYPSNFSGSIINYRLLLTVKHAYDNGCPDTISKQITVYPKGQVSFVSSPGASDICDSTSLKFTTTANAAVSSYYWNFDDGNSSNEKDPNHLFTNNTVTDKTCHIMLVGLTNQYCNDTVFKDITVHAFLDPQFSLDASTFCAPFNANIHNKSRGGITNYEWTYGDGSKDNHYVTDTVHLYKNPTSSVFAPKIKLVVTNSGGCKDSVLQTINVYPEIKASFTPGNVIECNPFPVSFKNNSTYVNQVSKFFKWEFGDNTTSDEREPNHVFTNLTNSSVIYPVKLTVTSDYNCTDDTVQNISVYPYVEAKFTVDTVKGCSPFPVNIHNSSRGSITGYSWSYGDGEPNDNNPQASFVHTYINNSTNNPGGLPLQRNLRLTVSNTNGKCFSKDSVMITVNPEVEANFITDVLEGCNPLKVNFTDKSGPTAPTRYSWEFGDGGTSASKNTSHTFDNLNSFEKTFQTKLLVYSVYNCYDTASVKIKVYPFIEAKFTFDNSPGCSPITAKIVNSSSAGVNGFEWSFGDGQNSTISASTFNHTYWNKGNAPVTYCPRLIVSYNGMCKDTMTQYLEVYPEVVAQFTEDTLKWCHPFNLKLTNTSTNANYYTWSFGDKATSVLESPTHSYNNFGTQDSVYNISLTATSTYNCFSKITKQVTVYPKPHALIDIDKSVSCPPFELQIRNLSVSGNFYNWDYGDGNNQLSTDLNPVYHTYDNLTASIATYDLKLMVQSVHNCTDEITQSINVFPRVLADFVPDTAGCSPFLVPFTNKTVRAVTYKWDFGDNISSALKNPSHKFFNNSVNDTTYKVGMIGFSELGCSDTAFRQITVYPQPMVEFSALPSYLYFPDAQVNIDNQTNAGSWNYHWDFGDDKTTDVIEPILHEYLHWGEYNITLKAWSSNCSDSVTHRIRIFAAKPIADFDASENGCVPITINFTNQSTWATTYKWEFDDGSSSTEVNPSHIYTKDGKYMVKLTAYGDGGEDVTYRTVEVYPKPKVSFSVSPSRVMLPESLVQTYNTTTLGYTYLWYFGDGDTARSFEPAHTYKELGKFDVTLNVWTEHQCFDSLVIKEAVLVEGEGKLDYPNAFKPKTAGPNGGKYDLSNRGSDDTYIFHPYYKGVATYKLEIYDRWGELLFETTDVNTGWDGYYKGKLCKSDVYIWKAKGKFYNGFSFNKAGDVTLLQ